MNVQACQCASVQMCQYICVSLSHNVHLLQDVVRLESISQGKTSLQPKPVPGDVHFLHVHIRLEREKERSGMMTGSGEMRDRGK